MDERKRVSRKQEKHVAKSIGGRVQPGSGSGSLNKGDVRTADALIELKTVLQGKKQITIKHADLLQIEREAMVSGRVPVFGIRMGNRDYVMLTREDWEEGRHGLGTVEE